MISAEEFEALALRRIRSIVPADELVFKAFFGMSRVGPRLTADFESAAHRPLGLTWPGFRLLFCLWVAGPLQTRELARLCATTAPTVSSVLNTLERNGYVTRHRLAVDQRLVEVRLTPEGDEVVAKAYEAQHQREHDWAAGIDEGKLAIFAEVLEHLAAVQRPGH